MKHKMDAKEKSFEIMKNHENNGLNFRESVEAAKVTVMETLKVLNKPNITNSLYKRSMNYLNTL